MVAHVKRGKLSCHTPAHVTMRLAKDLPSLRVPETFAWLKAAFAGTNECFECRIVHFSVQSNHLHLIVEARDERALGRGMKGLAVRIASALNRAWKRTGRVFPDRFHAEVLETPRQVRNALLYVLNNARRHGVFTIGHCDPYSSGGEFDGWIDQPCARRGLRGPRRAGSVQSAPVVAPEGGLASTRPVLPARDPGRASTLRGEPRVSEGPELSRARSSRTSCRFTRTALVRADTWIGVAPDELVLVALRAGLIRRTFAGRPSRQSATLRPRPLAWLRV